MPKIKPTRWTLAATTAGVALAALVLSACGAAKESGPRATTAPPSSGSPTSSQTDSGLGGSEHGATGATRQDQATQDAAARLPSELTPVRYNYTDGRATVTVPAGVTQAQVVVAGGSGGGWHQTKAGADQVGQRQGGKALVIHGTISVTGGETLTVGAGRAGGNPDGNKSPGVGGTSALSAAYSGGAGGGSKGGINNDAYGGGAASAILDGTTPLVVAGGGGGQGGFATLPPIPADPELVTGLGSWSGGDAGLNAGANGYGNGGDGHADDGGQGGSAAHPALDPKGQSYTGILYNGGGGGGGGGVYKGSGAYYGEGGGGGSSYITSTARNAWTSQQVTGADGFITIAWVQAPTLTIEEVGAPNGQLVTVPADGTDGAKADLLRSQNNSAGQVADNQVWTYEQKTGTATGQLVNLATGLCLELNGTDKRSIDQWDCADNHYNQLWTIGTEPQFGATVLQLPGVPGPEAGFLEADSPLAELAEDGTGLDLAGHGVTAQWRLQLVGASGFGATNGAWTIQKAGTSNQLLTVTGKGDDGTISTAPFPAIGDSTQPDQIWTWKPVPGTQSAQIVNRANNQCLEINGTTGITDTWPCLDHPNEYWTAELTQNGLAFRNVNDGTYLATPLNKKTTSGVQISTSPRNTTLDFDWQIRPVN